MSALASLATPALLGTERRPPEWPAFDGALGAVIARIPRDQTEKALLQTAGVLGTCQLAGLLPMVNANAPMPAEEDTSPQDMRMDLLTAIVVDGPGRLQAEAFQKLAMTGRRLPHRLLPKALEAGRRSAVLRPFLLPVLGQRGGWLAAQNQAWAYAAGSSPLEAASEDVWSHGSLEQRKLFLNKLRETDAARARELVTTALATEGAKERTAFLECLGVGLTLDDEPLLESALNDKGKEARQTAARLLSSLAQSRFSTRMAERLLPLLRSEKKFLRGTVVTLEAPAAYDSAWKADLIEETKPKGLSMGDRAWWLWQLVRGTPLMWWETQTEMKPADLLAWAQKSDWKDALLQGWAEAQANQRRVDWAEAFLGTTLPPNGPLTVFDLLETLPPVLREAHFVKLIADTQPNVVALSSVVDRFLQGLALDAPMLSHATATQVVKILKQRIHSGAVRYDWQLRASLVELACLLPMSAFDELTQGWQFDQEPVQPFAEAVARASIVLDQRRQLSQSQP